jgi:branched-chain amino acid transport system substrate-binding protein
MTTTTRRHGGRTRGLVAAVAVTSVLLAACGNSDGENSTATTAQPSESTEAPDGTTTEPDGATTSDPQSTEFDIGEFQPIEGVPGVTDEAISFAVVGTGPINPLGYCLLECYEAGVQAYFDWRNSIGGVHGRELTIGRTDDDEFGNTQVKMLEIAGDDKVFGVFAAPLQPNGFDAAADVGMPLYTTFPSSPAIVDVESSFVPGGIPCIDCSAPLKVYGASKAGKSKVAGLGFGVSQASKQCVDFSESDVKKYGPALGVEWVYKNSELAFGLPNGLGPEVTAMKDAGVDYVMTCIDQNSALVLAQEFKRQGMNDVVVLLPQGYGDSDFLSENADLLEGFILTTAFRPFEADPEDTLTPLMEEWLGKSGVLANDYAIQGWLGADIAVTGLLAAGPQFDRASVVAATNALTDYDAGGILPPTDWSTTGHKKPGANGATYRTCGALMQVSGGELTMVTDPASPFVCFDGPSDTYAEPEPFG